MSMSLLAKKRIRQNETLHFIYTYSQENGYSPTIKEIASHITACSTATLHRTIKDLCEDGFLSMLPHQNRSLALTEKGKTAVEDSVESDSFSFQIADDSMSRSGILQGDTVTVSKNQKAREGDIVVVAFVRDILCRRFSEKEGIGFYPDNPAYPVMKPTPRTYYQILGVVHSLQRNYQSNPYACERRNTDL